ncbi:MAG: hypothetical protein NWF06_10995, partial [Candidatus Bathyarchaeota archaeon]|nr:hypothetical protein [Candidatus Bathyarchaeum sp.]
IDAKILEELEMLYGDKDCFSSLHDWFGTAETYWTNIERLLLITEHTKKHYPSTIKEITAYNKRIIDLFHQTKNYVGEWDSKEREKTNCSTKDYSEATAKNWDALNQWTASQEKLRNAILDLVDFFYSISSEPYSK